MKWISPKMFGKKLLLLLIQQQCCTVNAACGTERGLTCCIHCTAGATLASQLCLHIRPWSSRYFCLLWAWGLKLCLAFSLSYVLRSDWTVIFLPWSPMTLCCVVFQSLEQQRQKLSELMEICQQKDDVINKLQAAMDNTVENATRDVNTHFLRIRAETISLLINLSIDRKIFSHYFDSWLIVSVHSSKIPDIPQFQRFILKVCCFPLTCLIENQ